MTEKAFDASVNGDEIAASRNGHDIVFAAKVDSEKETEINIRMSPVSVPNLPPIPYATV